VQSNAILTFGGGLMGELAKHLGIQVEVRVFHDLENEAGRKVNFTRAAAGVYIGF